MLAPATRARDLLVASTTLLVCLLLVRFGFDVVLDGHQQALRTGTFDPAVDTALRWRHLVELTVWVARLALTAALVVWLARARLIVESYDVYRMRSDVDWRVVGWVFPGLSMVAPYLMMSDVYVASAPGRAPGAFIERLKAPRRILLWWQLMVLSGILGGMLLRSLIDGRSSIQPFELHLDYGIVAAQVLAAPLLVWAVLRVTAFQQERFETGRL